VIAALLASGMLAVGLAYRAGRPRAWNAVAVYAVGGVISGYGLLIELLGEDALPAVMVGALISVAALGYLWMQAR
jgi:hydrogenase/urease accessory protein HupE